MLIWVLHKDLDMVNGHQHDSLHPMPLPVRVSYTSRHYSAAALPLNVTHHIYTLYMFVSCQFHEITFKSPFQCIE